MGIFTNLYETLEKSFYSDRDAKLTITRNKNLSTTTPEILTPIPDVIISDVTTNHMLGGQFDFILTKRNDLIRQWRNATYLPEVDEAIQEIINEALVFDEDETLPINIILDDLETTDQLKEKITEKFEKIMKLLEFTKRGEDLFKQWYVDGIINFEVVYNNKKRRDGIQKIILLNPYDFFKIKDITTGIVEFFYNNRLSSQGYDRAQEFNLIQLQQMAPRELKYKDEQITQIGSGFHSIDKLFSISNLNKAVKVINQVSLIEDSLIIYRITRAPEKKAFYIDTGRMPKAKAEQYIKQMMQKHRNKLNYNTQTGLLENNKKSIALQEDYWMARNAEGRGTQIETIQGTGQELRDIADLDYFYDKMYRALNVPVNRRKKEEARFTGMGANNVEVEREEIKFFKFVVNIRKRFNELFKDLLKKELISAEDVSYDDWEKIKDVIRFRYNNNNEYSEMKKLMVFESRMNIAAAADALVETHLISKAWVRREVLNQSEDEIKEMDKEIETEANEGTDDTITGMGFDKGGEPPGAEPPEAEEEPEAPEKEPKDDSDKEKDDENN